VAPDLEQAMQDYVATVDRWQATLMCWQPCIAAPNRKVQEQKKANA